jgi:hypothetical protein
MLIPLEADPLLYSRGMLPFQRQHSTHFVRRSFLHIFNHNYLDSRSALSCHSIFLVSIRTPTPVSEHTIRWTRKKEPQQDKSDVGGDKWEKDNVDVHSTAWNYWHCKIKFGKVSCVPFRCWFAEAVVSSDVLFIIYLSPNPLQKSKLPGYHHKVASIVLSRRVLYLARCHSACPPAGIPLLQRRTKQDM